MTTPTWALHEGDCLETMRLLPSESIDAIVTDPPYCSGGFSESEKQAADRQGVRHDNASRGWFTGDNMTTVGLAWLLRGVAFEGHRLLKPGGSLSMFCDWRMLPSLAPAVESAGLRYRNVVVWDKGSPGLGSGFRPEHELIMHYVKGRPRYYERGAANVIRIGRVPPRRRIHPTEKPVDLIRQIIRVVTPEGGTVLDPFAGSGSTLAAAVATGRNAIGIERDPAFCAAARLRLVERLTQAECGTEIGS